jgi:hypothetical protein
MLLNQIFLDRLLDKAYAECKADKSWSTIENTTSVHAVMVAEPEWLADTLMKVA